MVVAALPDLDQFDIEALKALLIAKHIESMEQHRSDVELIEHLKLVIEKYRRMIFGKKSEKQTAQLEQLEFRLEELETAQAADEATQAVSEATQPSAAQASTKARPRPARKPLPEDLPREVITHLPAHNCCPDCGGALRKFGEDVSEQLERIPATYKVIRHVRPKFACVGCERVVEAPAPARPIERGLPGPGLLAHVLVSKYSDHQPLYRQSEIYAREGIDLDRSTLAGWVGAASQWLASLVDTITSMCWQDRRSTPMTHRFRCLLPATARPRLDACGPMCATIARREKTLRPPSGLHTRKIARAIIRDGT